MYELGYPDHCDMNVRFAPPDLLFLESWLSGTMPYLPNNMSSNSSPQGCNGYQKLRDVSLAVPLGSDPHVLSLSRVLALHAIEVIWTTATVYERTNLLFVVQSFLFENIMASDRIRQ